MKIDIQEIETPSQKHAYAIANQYSAIYDDGVDSLFGCPTVTLKSDANFQEFELLKSVEEIINDLETNGFLYKSVRDYENGHLIVTIGINCLQA